MCTSYKIAFPANPPEWIELRFLGAAASQFCYGFVHVSFDIHSKVMRCEVLRLLCLAFSAIPSYYKIYK